LQKKIVVLDADEEFVIFSRNTFWTSLFVRHFLEVADDALRDDMLFYVRKCRGAKSKSKTQQVGLLCVTFIYCIVAGCEIVFISVLHGMPARTSDEKGVCLSVKRVNRDKMEEKSVQIFIPYHLA